MTLQIETWVWTYAFVFCRIAACIAVMPALGERGVPPRVRLCVAAAFALVVWPVAQFGIEGGDIVTLTGYLVCEIIVGLILGVFLRCIAAALEVAGHIIANTTSLAQAMGNAAPDASPAIAHLIYFSGLCLALLLGLHTKLVVYFVVSYEWIPFATTFSVDTYANQFLHAFVTMFEAGFAVAVPFLILSVAYNAGLGFVNRAMPQMMVAMVGAPAIAFGSIAFLGVLLPTILLRWHEILDVFLQTAVLP